MRTHVLVLLHGLVVSSSKLRPLRELVLRAGVVHLALQLEGFTLLFLLFARISRG